MKRRGLLDRVRHGGYLPPADRGGRHAGFPREAHGSRGFPHEPGGEGEEVRGIGGGARGKERRFGNREECEENFWHC